MEICFYLPFFVVFQICGQCGSVLWNACCQEETYITEEERGAALGYVHVPLPLTSSLLLAPLFNLPSSSSFFLKCLLFHLQGPPCCPDRQTLWKSCNRNEWLTCWGCRSQYCCCTPLNTIIPEHKQIFAIVSPSLPLKQAGKNLLGWFHTRNYLFFCTLDWGLLAFYTQQITSM